MDNSAVESWEGKLFRETITQRKSDELDAARAIDEAISRGASDTELMDLYDAWANLAGSVVPFNV